jgi:hypothetical protein
MNTFFTAIPFFNRKSPKTSQIINRYSSIVNHFLLEFKILYYLCPDYPSQVQTLKSGRAVYLSNHFYILILNDSEGSDNSFLTKSMKKSSLPSINSVQKVGVQNDKKLFEGAFPFFVILSDSEGSECYSQNNHSPDAFPKVSFGQAIQLDKTYFFFFYHVQPPKNYYQPNIYPF